MQRTLFEVPEAPEPKRKIARHSDPDTSHMAAVETEKQIGAIHAVVLQIFDEVKRPLTANEAALTCVAEDPRRTAETYRKRLKELADAGELEVCGQRNCAVTKKMCQEYRRNR